MLERLLVAVVLFAFSQVGSAATVTRAIAPGVSLTQEIDNDPPQIINVLFVDLNNPLVHVETGHALSSITGPTGDILKGRESVQGIANRYHAIAAVNGDYFPFTGDPIGVAIHGGDLFSEPYVKGRAGIGFTANKHVLIDVLAFRGILQAADDSSVAITAVDRPLSETDPTDLVLYTPSYGPFAGSRNAAVECVCAGLNGPMTVNKTHRVSVVSVGPMSAAAGAGIAPGGVVLSALPNGPAAAFLQNHVHPGDMITLSCGIFPRAPASPPKVDPPAHDWSSVKEAIGGGPWLVENGKPAVDGDAEGFDASFIGEPNPRTAVGVTADNHLVILTIDGRQTISAGASLSDLASIMVRYGAVNAMNLDGGGSTTMDIDGLTVSSPSGSGNERPVADALMVFADPPIVISNVPDVSITVPTTAIDVGKAVQLGVVVNNNPIPPTSPHMLWGGEVSGGIGFVSQDGIFHAQRPGTGTVSLIYHDNPVQAQVTVMGPQEMLVYDIHLKVTGAPGGAPNRSMVSVRVVTGAGTPLPHAAVHLSVAGGTPDLADVTTDVDGETSTGITWAGQAGTITATSGKLSPATVSYQYDVEAGQQ